MAMGFQTAAIRFVHVPEIPIVAATLATFGVVVGLTGEHGDRTSLLRRVGVVAAILFGAVLGAGLARGNPGLRGPRLLSSWPAWACSPADGVLDLSRGSVINGAQQSRGVCFPNW